jgi:hypothetical protein
MAKNNARNAGAKKLVLNKETLQQLSQQDLASIRGGGGEPAAPTPDCSKLFEESF